MKEASGCRSRSRHIESGADWLDGSALAKQLVPHFDAAEPIELRLTLADYHGGKIISKPLLVTIAELSREDRR